MEYFINYNLKNYHYYFFCDGLGDVYDYEIFIKN